MLIITIAHCFIFGRIALGANERKFAGLAEGVWWFRLIVSFHLSKEWALTGTFYALLNGFQFVTIGSKRGVSNYLHCETVSGTSFSYSTY